LAFGVTASTGGTLVGTLQRDRVIQKLCFLEAGRCVAVFASRSIVLISGWLVAIGALGFLCQVQSLVAVQALRFGMFADQIQRVRIGLHLSPHFC
jgi:hypothetical protein